jgi:hypothetical protein
MIVFWVWMIRIEILNYTGKGKIFSGNGSNRVKKIIMKD